MYPTIYRRKSSRLPICCGVNLEKASCETASEKQRFKFVHFNIWYEASICAITGYILHDFFMGCVFNNSCFLCYAKPMSNLNSLPDFTFSGPIGINTIVIEHSRDINIVSLFKIFSNIIQNPVISYPTPFVPLFAYLESMNIYSLEFHIWSQNILCKGLFRLTFRNYII